MIYTKTGDKGTTSLVDGSRVSKCSLRVETYGTVDELNAHLGLLGEMILAIPDETDYQQVKKIQDQLFVIQTLLATEEAAVYEKLPQLSAFDVASLEQSIDAIVAKLPPINSFVIPGGSMAGAQAHICRCVCRRAERLIVQLSQNAAIASEISCFMNRLSDYLFVLSRHLVLLERKNENFWHSI